MKGTSRATRGKREAGRGRESHGLHLWWCHPRNKKGTRIDKRRNAVSPSHLPVTFPWTLNHLVRYKD